MTEIRLLSSDARWSNCPGGGSAPSPVAKVFLSAIRDPLNGRSSPPSFPRPPTPAQLSSGRASIDIILLLLRMDESGTNTALYAKHACLVRSACAAHARVARWLCHAAPIAQSLALVPIGARATDAGRSNRHWPRCQDRYQESRSVGCGHRSGGTNDKT